MSTDTDEPSTENAGRFWHCTKEEYDNETEHLRCSHLKDFTSEGRKYFHKVHVLKTMPGKEKTDAMTAGDCIHEYLFADKKEWVVWRGKMRNGKAWDEFEAEHAGKNIVLPKTDEAIRWMLESVMENPIARELLESDGYEEVGARWEHESGILCKCRFDKLAFDHRVPDLKKVGDDSEEFFSRQVATFRYDIQQAFYSMGRDALLGESNAQFLFITVCEKPPYNCRVREIEPDAVKMARNTVNRKIHELAECRKTGNWNDPEDVSVTTIQLPAWHYYANAIDR